jgi:hypothetical protein
MGVLLAQSITRNGDQPLLHASKLLNSVEHNYNTTKIEALVNLHCISLGIFCWEIILC